MQNITLNTLFTTEQVAKSYGISQDTIRDHLKNHSDEILENIHFMLEFNRFNNKVVKWTLKGIVVLGFFIRSKEAKNFRIWASNQLERELLKQAQDYKEARARNLELTDKVTALDALLIDNAKRHKREINGYKSQLKQHNDKIVVLKHELEKASNPRPSDPIYAQIKAERDYYKERYKKLSQSKDETIILNLAKIQKELEKSYTAIGAVMAYANDNDRFFIEQNEILKG